MTDYVKQLEQQNEQLQQRLATAELWEPVWVQMPHDPKYVSEEWAFTNGLYIHGRIKRDKGSGKFLAYMLSNNQSTWQTNSIEEAKMEIMKGLAAKRVKRDASLRDCVHTYGNHRDNG
jgi:hypothetical protein